MSKTDIDDLLDEYLYLSLRISLSMSRGNTPSESQLEEARELARQSMNGKATGVDIESEENIERLMGVIFWNLKSARKRRIDDGKH